MSAAHRTFITTAQVQARDLQPDDHVLLEAHGFPTRWRALFDVHTEADSVLVELGEETAKQVQKQAESVRLDTHQDGMDGPRHHVSATPRPARHPVLIECDSLSVSAHPPGQARSPKTKSGVTTVRSEALVHALLSTDEYVAVRYVREETSDGGQVDDGWAVFTAFAPVTIQITLDQTKER